jgi:biotin operon repressor
MKQSCYDVLNVLRHREWVSSVDLARLTPSLSHTKRISELKKMGYKIESRRKAGETFKEHLLISEPTLADAIEIIHAKEPCRREIQLQLFPGR